jgi:thiamine-monophosphate kinase
MLLGRNRAATACIDTSDGLADAVTRIAEASGAGVLIDADALPIDRACAEWWTSRGADPVREALAASDDYELVFTVAARARGRFAHVRRHAGAVALTRIGTVTADPGVVLRRPQGDEPIGAGYDHFAPGR